jgi:hypothetical protein
VRRAALAAPVEWYPFLRNHYQLDELEGFTNLLAMICQEAEASDPLLRVQEHYAQIIGSKLISLMSTNVSRECLSAPNVSFERILDYIERNLKLDLRGRTFRPAVRARDEAYLRRQLDLPGAREPGGQQQRLLHDPHRPPAGLHRAQPPGRAERLHQCLQPPRRPAVPPQARQQGDLHLPVPRLDLQQQRQAAEGEGPGKRRLPECFNKEGSHDLKKLARFANYKGFLFGSVNPDVPPLEDFLGEAGKIIDMIVNQSPEGLEVLRGSSTYTFDGNWKLQAENGADGYHVTAVHWNYAATTNRRKEEAGGRRGQDPRHGRRQLGPPGRRLLRLRPRPHAAVVEVGQSAGPSRISGAMPNSPRSTASRPPTGWSSARATCACIRTST